MKMALKEGKLSQAEYNRQVAERKKHKKQSPPKKQVTSSSGDSKPSKVMKKIRVSDQGSYTPGTKAMNLIKTRPSDMITNYIGAMLDPKNYVSRIPDSFNRKTGVFRSVVTYDYPFATGISDSQRFSVALQPIMGSLGQPLTYQLGIVNNAVTGNDWSNVDWASPNTYCANLGGCDPRLDINSPYLVSNPDVYFQCNTTFTGPALSGRSIFANPGDLNAVPVISSLTYRLALRQAAVDYSAFTLPKGTWRVTVSMIFTPSATVANGTILIPNYTGNTTTVQRVTETWSVNETTVAVSTTGVYQATVISTGEPGGNILSLGMCAQGSTVLIANPTAMTTRVTVSNCTVSGYDFNMSNGVIEQIRPVGCSIWASCSAPQLVNGGYISAAYVEKDYLESNYYANADSALGQGQFHESLSKVEGAYNGPFRDGAYVWWSPQDTGSLQFLDVATSNQQQWPSLVVSGQFSPCQTVGSVNGILRFECCFVFEYITKSTAFEQIACLGSQAMIDQAQQILGREAIVHAMANGKHKSFIASVMKTASGVGRFLAANPGLVTAGLSLL
jgi:hypothetical protein